MSEKRVIVACEYSGRVRDAFRKLGFDAWSCDLLPTDSDPEFHHAADVFDVIENRGPWDLILMHPPCTALCVSGNRHYGTGMPKNTLRQQALDWTVALWNTARQRARVGVSLENPIGVLTAEIGKPSQIIQPWQFGHGETKATCLWLDRLPLLVPTQIVEGREQRIWKMGPSPTRGKERSLTYQGIADAMADQWSKVLLTN